MKTFPLSFKRLAKLIVFACFATASSFVSADTFTDRTEWEAAICGVESFDELEYGQSGFGFPLDLALTTNWGVFDYTEAGFSDNNGFDLGGDPGIVVGEPAINLIPNPGQNVDGISLAYGGALVLCIELADGTLIEETAQGDTVNFERQFFGWTNTTGQAVAAVQVKAVDSSDGSDGVFLYGAGVSFGECDVVVDTCQSMLQDIIDALEAKLVVASSCDQHWIEDAIYELECAQNPALWETENRLSDLGCAFFCNNFYATYYLECVYDDALVEDCLIGIQDMLGCVVQAEIDFALENPDVSTNLLLYAEYFENYADQFADAELYLQAVILHFYAWLFANNA